MPTSGFKALIAAEGTAEKFRTYCRVQQPKVWTLYTAHPTLLTAVSMNLFSLAFLTVLGLMVAIEIYLARRHMAHVRAHDRAVPDAFAGQVSLEAHQKAASYTVAKQRFGLLIGLIDAALLVAWTVGSGLDLLDTLLRQLDLGPLVSGALFFVCFALLSGALGLPASIYSTFVIEERFGFNKTTPRLFVIDLVKQVVLLLLLGGPLLLLVLWLMQVMGAAWWLYVWGVWISFSLLMVWAYPRLIAPLFNKFEPLPEGSTLTRIQALLGRTGFRSSGVFVMDGSKRSSHGNAYFTGLGKSKRIVFFDTLLNTLTQGELEAVLAHELGHFRRHHIKKRMALAFLMSFAGLAVLGWLIDESWFYAGLGLSQPSTYGALLLFAIASPPFTFLLGPVFAWLSRRDEFEADAFAAKQASAGDLVTALVKLYKENASTLTPDPLHSVFYDSHPPAPVRVAHLQGLSLPAGSVQPSGPDATP